MKNVIYLLTLFTLCFGCASPETNKTARELDFNFNWKFHLSNNNQSDFSSETINEKNWENIKLPHDWVIGNQYDSTNAEFAPATGYIFGGGTGWYRKEFDLVLSNSQKAFIHFDGVYNNSEVFINGKKLGFHPYGYSPFYYDLTPYIKKNSKNTLAVKVDHTRYADSRWYTGAGIYRNVKLVVTNKLYVPIWGTFITTPEVVNDNALVNVTTTIRNDYNEDKSFKLLTELYNDDGIKVGESSKTLAIDKNKEIEVIQKIKISNPIMWDVENPHLYKAITRLQIDNEQIDVLSSNFGVRKIKFDANKGFFLNDKNMKIKGVCLHHDAGLVGTAVPKDVWRRRLQTLKDGGCNAIRIAHNPASSEFLDLCDELGFLVQDEFFDEWDYPKDKRFNQKEQSQNKETEGYANYFHNYGEDDLKSVMKSHRNHPSIFQWSIGNEIEWTYPRVAKATGFFGNMNWNGNYFWSKPPYSTAKIKEELTTLPHQKYDIGITAKKLVGWTKEMDTSRPVVANCILPSASHETQYGQSLDIVGYSYRRVLYDYGHEMYPNKVIMGTENLAQYHEWKAVMDRPFIAGTFFWTGIDYLGEIRGPWPIKGNNAGMIDFAGFTKPSYHMIKTLWSDDPHTYIATQEIEKSINKIDPKTGLMVAKDPNAWKQALWEWHDVNNHWNYTDKQLISVEMYSNCESIELFLNEKSLGQRNLSEFEDHIYKWAVPFEKGKLTAVGIKNGQKIETTLQTAGKPTGVKLSVDKSSIDNDEYEVAHVVAQLVDADGLPVKNQERIINFEIPENLRVLGVDNGAINNVQTHNARKLLTSNGRALIILQSKDGKGKVEVKAKVEGLLEDKILLTIKEKGTMAQDVYAELN
ncbi:glycoside hydrolase family 2 TIM barrel-domain containing protein [Flammeovirga kamogawensis]|uniref:DUF4982 domain-containing protein n=1 Tax=Flammeovirga kamogawensis TaxID=373891 RepID=A0ABX8H410_9BACT|nr:glycoside hydrolase family 2 TIM barrel-domain containing protein [Flammeovirga kamogawensis]MBB6460368.1 beta-galactosidase/beta-glucuronidase [Flammeovirga kamogawensis]QWG10176.1 DUF4982 domain-containing protein [Flammeovirga kamogawensis]TRX64628.1 glycoside hydrolase family 2 protein [Flammeovirga kamogawensis]